jgi:hypothetical protein
MSRLKKTNACIVLYGQGKEILLSGHCKMKKRTIVCLALFLVSVFAVGIIYQVFIVPTYKSPVPDRVVPENDRYFIGIGPLLRLSVFTNDTQNAVFVQFDYIYQNMTLTQLVIKDVDANRTVVTQPLSIQLLGGETRIIRVNCLLPDGNYDLFVNSTRGTHGTGFSLPQ